MTTPKPLPPAELVGALQDRVHTPIGKYRAAKAHRAPSRPQISLPPLPDVRDGEGRRICAVGVTMEPGSADRARAMGFCGRPGRRNGRCTRCYQREYAAELRRLQGRTPATTLDDPQPLTVQLPAKALRELDAHRATRPGYARSEWVRDAVEMRLAIIREQGA